MDMSKLEAGRLLGHFRPVQLGQLTADLAALFRSMAEKKSIEYEIVCSVVDEPPIYVDVGMSPFISEFILLPMLWRYLSSWTDLWEKIVCNL